MFTEIVGYLAAFITTVCYLPQAIHVIRTKHLAGISLLAYSMLFVGVSLWALYGILKNDWPLMGANILSLMLIGPILVMKIRHR